jgi:EmrB/QacA subfamily drug resistance transporter
MNESRRAWQTFWLAAATLFMVALDATVVVAAFPALRAAFSDTSAATLSWTINAYTIVFAALLVPFGRRVDQFGPRRCFLLSTSAFTLASAACGLATSAEWLTAARILQAVAAAMISPASLALILAAFPTEHRSRSAGLWSAVGALAAASGPAIGSLLIEWFSWRMIFLINLPIGLAVFLLARLRLPSDPTIRSKSSLDLAGTLLLIFAVSGLAAGLSQAGESALFSSSFLAPLGLGFVMSIAFFFWAKNRTDAALDLRLFADPIYRWASLATLVLGIAFGLMFLSFYLLFTGVWHYSQATAGLAATPGPLLATLVAAGLSQRFSKDHFHRPMLLGGLIFALSNTWLAMRVQLEPAYLSVWLPGQLLSGIAIGLMLPSIAAAAVSTLPQHQLGIGSAVNTALRQLGSSLGVALAVALVGSGYAAVAPFQLVYACLIVCGCLVATIAWKLRSRPACSMD